MRQKIGFSGSTLKWFAIITMLIDHIGAVVILQGLYREVDGTLLIRLLSSDTQEMIRQGYYVLRGIGRLAFPIFCFFLVEGYEKTRDARKYALRLLIFGIVSEIPFNLAVAGALWDPTHQNVLFTLFIGLLTIMGLHHAWDGELENLDLKSGINVVLSIACGCAAGAILKTDYGYAGVALIVVIYLCRNRRDVQCLAGAGAISWENWAPLSFLLLYFYNGQRGRQNKYVFYVFYPVHLLILYAIAKWGLPWLLT